MKKYTAKKPLLHSKTGEFIKIGEKVDLSHLTPEQIDILIGKDAIALVTSKEKNNG